jgi:uncharacterized protein (DUF1684 family)
MRKTALLLLLCSFTVYSYARTYKDSIADFRSQYKSAFLEDKRSPLKASDTSFLRFYPTDHSYCVLANLKLTADAKPFAIPTHSGKTKNYVQYGLLIFKLRGKEYTLHVYQGIDLIAKDPKFKDYLFIPFTDETNYTETFGGGRYLDLSVSDIKNNQMVLDFNKCYNPYCAFADGFSCPIPPKENALPVKIKAGEKLFGRKLTKD